MIAEFEKWPSISRRSKEVMVITEKINGTNACVIFLPSHLWTGGALPLTTVTGALGDSYDVFAQSRTRFIYPDDDNFGFAWWVNSNAQALFDTLGVGKHFGEWWGSGLPCSYGLKEKRFSLFNARRWQNILAYDTDQTSVEGLRIVPLLYVGPFVGKAMDDAVARVTEGSVAVPGFKSEGVVVYFREMDSSLKILVENDDIHKWEVAKNA